VSYTRIISFKLYYYYTYLTIGLALLGLGSGAVFMAVGLFAISYPDPFIFKLGLATIIVGNGMFKPNISTMVGKLYGIKDERREARVSLAELRSLSGLCRLRPSASRSPPFSAGPSTSTGLLRPRRR
jgi:hypothetical protein